MRVSKRAVIVRLDEAVLPILKDRAHADRTSQQQWLERVILRALNTHPTDPPAAATRPRPATTAGPRLNPVTGKPYGPVQK